MSERVLDSRVGAIDRTLGFVYGLVRGLILVVIAYLIVGQIVDAQEHARMGNEGAIALIESTGESI